MVNPNEFLELGTNWAWDGETITKANGFLYQLQSPFLICFKILLEVFYAYKQVNSIVSTLKGMRDNSNREFHKSFEEATKLGKPFMERNIFSVCHALLDVNPIAAIPVSQAQKTIIESPSTMSFCHKSSLHEIEKRFIVHGIGILNLLPSECCKHEVEDDIPLELAQAVEFYQSDLPQPSAFPMEYRTWVRNWKQHDSNQLPCKLVDILKVCGASLSSITLLC